MAGNAYIKPAGKLSDLDSSLASSTGDCQFSVPFAGERYDDVLLNEGYYGNFWSGTYDDDYGDNAYYLYCNKDYGYWFINNRDNGLSVRPVTEK